MRISLQSQVSQFQQSNDYNHLIIISKSSFIKRNNYIKVTLKKISKICRLLIKTYEQEKITFKYFELHR